MQLDGLSALSRDSPQSTCSSNLDERSVQHICRTAAQCAPHLESTAGRAKASNSLSLFNGASQRH